MQLVFSYNLCPSAQGITCLDSQRLKNWLRGKYLALFYNDVTFSVEEGSADEDYTAKPYILPDWILEKIELGWLEKRP